LPFQPASREILSAFVFEFFNTIGQKETPGVSTFIGLPVASDTIAGDARHGRPCSDARNLGMLQCTKFPQSATAISIVTDPRESRISPTTWED
jgi:hypothetical protein